MKALKFFIIIFCFFLGYSFVHAQTIPPEAFNYSAVARDANGAAYTNTSLGIQIAIRQSASDGELVYQENHTVETDNFGVFNIAVGMGNVLEGSMGAINWGFNDYYLEVSMDVNGGTNFQVMGSTQMLSVPYALHARTAGSAVLGGNGLYIGMEYQGGIIFHLFTEGDGIQRGLIVALNDLGQAEWGFVGTDIPGAGSTWNGEANTQDIINAGGAANEAAGLCANYSSGGFDDWYLPSVQELNMLWNNYYDVSKALNTHPDATELLPDYYWSSMEGSADVAWFFRFGLGGANGSIKSFTRRVRAVRTF
jgi:hypothetical protein